MDLRIGEDFVYRLGKVEIEGLEVFVPEDVS